MKADQCSIATLPATFPITLAPLIRAKFRINNALPTDTHIRCDVDIIATVILSSGAVSKRNWRIEMNPIGIESTTRDCSNRGPLVPFAA